MSSLASIVSMSSSILMPSILMIDVEFDGNDDFDDDGDIDDNCDVDKALSYRRDWMEDDYVRVHSQLNVKSCLLCVFHTSVVTAKCVPSQQLQITI